MSTIRPIRNDRDYRRAVARIDALVVQPDAETNDELELLSILVEAYEARQVPEVPLDPIAYLKASMSNRGLTQTDLAQVLGSSSRAAEVLGGKRELSKGMIRALVEDWHLDANTLIGTQQTAA